jgi:hypothetical protein
MISDFLPHASRNNPIAYVAWFVPRENRGLEGKKRVLELRRELQILGFDDHLVNVVGNDGEEIATLCLTHPSENLENKLLAIQDRFLDFSVILKEKADFMTGKNSLAYLRKLGDPAGRRLPAPNSSSLGLFLQHHCGWKILQAKVSAVYRARTSEEVASEFLLARVETSFPRMLEYASYILTRPDLESAVLPYSRYMAIYFGVSKIRVGKLLRLWRKGGWVGECDACHQVLYIIGWSGSALSGDGNCVGYCAGCQRYHSQSMRGGHLMGSLSSLSGEITEGESGTYLIEQWVGNFIRMQRSRKEGSENQPLVRLLDFLDQMAAIEMPGEACFG